MVKLINEPLTEEVAEAIDTTGYGLNRLNIFKQDTDTSIKCKPGLKGVWYALRNVGEALSAGFTPVVGFDNPYLISKHYSQQFTLVPESNYLTCDGGLSVIMVCDKAEYDAQAQTRTEEWCRTHLPADMLVTKAN